MFSLVNISKQEVEEGEEGEKDEALKPDEEKWAGEEEEGEYLLYRFKYFRKSLVNFAAWLRKYLLLFFHMFINKL